LMRALTSSIALCAWKSSLNRCEYKLINLLPLHVCVTYSENCSSLLTTEFELFLLIYIWLLFQCPISKNYRNNSVDHKHVVGLLVVLLGLVRVPQSFKIVLHSPRSISIIIVIFSP
jgi:hypothetical protein